MYTERLTWIVMMIQNSKKDWTRTYVKNQNIREALDGYVDTQSAFVKQILSTADVYSNEISKELGKFPAAR